MREMRGGPKFKDCQQCRTYEYVKRGLDKANWINHADGRLRSHYERHNRMGSTFVSSVVLGMDYLKQEIPAGYVSIGDCKLCKDYEHLKDDIDWWGDWMKRIGGERHHLLHKGYDEHKVGWYKSDWDFQEELRRVEFWFFEVMNRKHIVNRGWQWYYGGWEAVGRGCGGFEVVWNPRSDIPPVYEQFFGYPNNAEPHIGDFPYRMELIG